MNFTDENNRLIDEFVGAKISIGGNVVTLNHEGIEQSQSVKNIKYHSSWNCIMPVIEKIESIKDDHHGRFGVYINSNNCHIQSTKFRSIETNQNYYFADYTLETKLLSTYQAIVEFIKWYNTQDRVSLS